MKFDGIIFDLDGVLCRTDRYHLAAWSELASELGLKLPPDIAERTRGIGRMESLELVLGPLAARLTPDEKERLGEKKNRFPDRVGKRRIADACAGVDKKCRCAFGRQNAVGGCMTAECGEFRTRYDMRAAAAEASDFHHGCL